MSMTALDWAIVGAYGVFALLAGIVLSKRAGKSMASYFVSGRNLSWWMLGTSMVATTFAADTPLAVSGIVATDGIAGNWLWWNLALAHLLAAVVFSRLWRRAGTVTDLEFIELRYSGKPAALLRGFRGLYEGVVMNCIVMGWVMLAMSKLMGVLFDFQKLPALAICLVLALAYTVLSGFWGVVVTDLVQFVMAMAGSIVLAFFAVERSGGLGSLALSSDPVKLRMFPEPGSWLFTSFLIYMSVAWWSNREVDGGGYLAQRMLAAKDEDHARKGALWFAVAHYALRPWPWILVGLASMAVYSKTGWFKKDPELGYVMMMKECLPQGLKGLVVASFFAAFMSTMDTHLNWGSSYLVNDVYKRFMRPGRPESEYVLAARLSSIMLMAAGTMVAALMQSISGGWKLMWQLTAGVGGVYMARWLWWRVNAWSEIAAWTSSSVVTVVLAASLPDLEYPLRLAVTAVSSTACWLAVTFLTEPVRHDVLSRFYLKVRPGGPGWRKLRSESRVAHRSEPFLPLSWLGSAASLYCLLFGVGELLLGDKVLGLVLSVFGLLLGSWCIKTLSKIPHRE